MTSDDKASRPRREKAGHWAVVKAIFLEAADHTPAARAGFLEKACAGDATLRQRVEALFAADQIADSPLENPISELALRLIHRRAETSAIGRRIGAHRVLRLLGHGGMGTVYLAVRDDGQYRDEVAIKLIRAGLDSEAILGRFRQERQILANLNHPNIGRLLDGGVTEDGAPYLVMEHIEGEPVDRYCDARRLTITERVELMRTVCRAVQAAHRNLVVHCDLKPSNILVTLEGTPKLLDFGVARLLDPDRGGQAAVTIASRLMTPEYASPEQIRGEPLTTASDIYSLGVVLYELLTGRSPYGAGVASRYELEREICERQPPKPSTVLMAPPADGVDNPAPTELARSRGTSAERWRRLLTGDLDTIVHKALDKEPERRYGSAEELAEDLRRYLTGLPVLARQPTLAYRAGKFLRRHKLSVAAAAMVLLSLFGGVVATAYQARIARARGLTAERTLAYLVELFETADPDENVGGRLTLGDVLSQGAGKIQDELRDEPLAQATLMDTIGQVYRRIGRYQQAQPLLEQALDLRRQALGPRHADLAASLAHLGFLYGRQAKLPQAMAKLHEALAMRRELFGAEHPDIAENLHELGFVLKMAGRFDEAESYYREALAMRRRLFGDGHRDVALTLNNLSVVLMEQGEIEAATDALREALEMRRQLLGAKHWRVSSTLANLGTLYRRQGDLDAAEDTLRDALAIQQELGAHRTVAMTLNNLGRVLMDRAALDDAVAAFGQAREILIELAGEGHPDVAMVNGNHGQALLRRGELDEAERLLRAAFSVHRDRLNEFHPYVATSARHLAQALRARGALDEAESLLRDALSRTRRGPSPRPGLLAGLLLDLGQLLLDRGDPTAAEPLLREGSSLRREASRRPAMIAKAQTRTGS